MLARTMLLAVWFLLVGVVYMCLAEMIGACKHAPYLASLAASLLRRLRLVAPIAHVEQIHRVHHGDGHAMLADFAHDLQEAAR